MSCGIRIQNIFEDTGVRRKGGKLAVDFGDTIEIRRAI
jgi:hypothetical protein